MSLKIYLDDCAYARQLATLLRGAGHAVRTPAEAGTSRRSDDVHFQYAVAHGFVLLTKNPGDFEALHQANPVHPGILAIYQDNDPDRDMAYADIVRAIGNLENAGIELPGKFHVLNPWRY